MTDNQNIHYPRLVEETEYLLFKGETAPSIKAKKLQPQLTDEQVDYVVSALSFSPKNEKLDWGFYGFEISGALIILLGLYCILFVDDEAGKFFGYFFTTIGVITTLKRFVFGTALRNREINDRRQAQTQSLSEIAANLESGAWKRTQHTK